MAKYNVHGGHAAYGKAFCGASDLIDESKEDRLVKDSLVKYLKLGGVTVYDCTIDTGSSQRNVLEKICKRCNAHTVDLDISIHFNSGRNDKKGDEKQGGFEIYATKYDSTKKAIAERMVAKMKTLGFGMHGDPYKTTSSLYYLNHTKSKALLLEICFVDDKDDVDLYKEVGYDAIGKVLAEAILNKAIDTNKTTIKANTKVKIKSGAVYGGSANGKKVSDEYIGKAYTVSKLQKNNGQQEALIKDLNSWVPTKYLVTE